MTWKLWKFRRHRNGVVAAAGDRDRTFGVDGIVRVDVPGFDFSQGRCVALRDDGRMLLGGAASHAVPTNELPDLKFAVTCLDAQAGDIDRSFAVAGHIAATFSGANSNVPSGFCLLANGYILVYGESQWVGRAPLQSYSMASLALLDERGLPARNWGINGTRAMALQGWSMARVWPFPSTEGRLLLVGAAYDETNAGSGLIVHLRADGWLDTSVNGTGVDPFPFPGRYDGAELKGINDCVANDDGSFMVAGSRTMRGLVEKIDARGALVESFGEKGLVYFDPPDPNVDVTVIEKIVVLGGQRVLCVGSTRLASDASIGMMAVLTADGSHDPDFNQGSVLLLDRLPRFRLAQAAVDAVGRFVLAGSASSSRDLIVVRVLPSGVLDTSFGNGKGYILDHPGDGQDMTMVGGMALDSEGRMVVCGWTMTIGGSDITSFVARYLSHQVRS